MRPIALLGLLLTLSGCVSSTWWNPPFTTGYDPHLPIGDSANLRRVIGDRTAPEPLMPEPGDIWPGPLPPTPTLRDLQDNRPLGEQPAATQRGSSTPPASFVAPNPQPRPAQSSAFTPIPQPGERNPAGQAYPTPSGPAVTTGGTQNYQSATTPGGGSAIIVPNGNGTSTVIHSDGRIETVPTPR